MKKIRAKMKCHTAERVGDSEVVQLTAAGNTAQENADFVAAAQPVPSASVTMSVSNPKAIGFFEKGKEYYLDFTRAEAKPPDS